MSWYSRWKARHDVILTARTEQSARTKGAPVMAAPAAVWRPAKPGDTPGQLVPQLAAAAPRPAPTLVPPSISTLDPRRCPTCGEWLAFGMAHYCNGQGADHRPERRVA